MSVSFEKNIDKANTIKTKWYLDLKEDLEVDPISVWLDNVQPGGPPVQHRCRPSLPSRSIMAFRTNLEAAGWRKHLVPFKVSLCGQVIKRNRSAIYNVTQTPYETEPRTKHERHAKNISALLIFNISGSLPALIHCRPTPFRERSSEFRSENLFHPSWHLILLLHLLLSLLLPSQ